MAEAKRSAAQAAFLDLLSPESLEAFNQAAAGPFKEQAVFFLNAFWDEVGDQAEFIYTVSIAMMRLADMKAKGVSLWHMYDEGVDLDFDMGLFFFEKLCQFVEDPTRLEFKPMGLPTWVTKEHPSFRTEFVGSLPEMKTAIVRKKELRDEVDVNFDGRISMLEYLLYQYHCSPKDLMNRSMAQPDEHPEITRARQALAEVQKAIKAYEKRKHELEEAAKLSGVKGLRAKNELAQLGASPLWETLNRALITAEAAVRIATRKFGDPASAAAAAQGDQGPIRNQGTIWWMNRELKEAQDRYGKKK